MLSTTLLDINKTLTNSLIKIRFHSFSFAYIFVKKNTLRLGGESKSP